MNKYHICEYTCTCSLLAIILNFYSYESFVLFQSLKSLRCMGLRDWEGPARYCFWSWVLWSQMDASSCRLEHLALMSSIELWVKSVSLAYVLVPFEGPENKSKGFLMLRIKKPPPPVVPVWSFPVLLNFDSCVTNELCSAPKHKRFVVVKCKDAVCGSFWESQHNQGALFFFNIFLPLFRETGN